MYKIAIKADGTKEIGEKIIKFLEFLGGKNRLKLNGSEEWYHINENNEIHLFSYFIPTDYKEIPLPNIIFKDEMGNDVYDYLCPVWFVERNSSGHYGKLSKLKQIPNDFDKFAYFIHKADADAFIEKNNPTQEKTFPRVMWVSDDVDFAEKYKKVVWCYSSILRKPFRTYDGINSLNEIREGEMMSDAWKYAKDLDELEATITMSEALEICAKAKNVDKIKII